jgi:hypothetical protein
MRRKECITGGDSFAGKNAQLRKADVFRQLLFQNQSVADH